MNKACNFFDFMESYIYEVSYVLPLSQLSSFLKFLSPEILFLINWFLIIKKKCTQTTTLSYKVDNTGKARPDPKSKT